MSKTVTHRPPTRPKPQVGDRLWFVKTHGYNPFKGKGTHGYFCRVTKVGHKYFECVPEDEKSGHSPTGQQFYIDTWRQKTKYSTDCHLYASMQEYLDEKERLNLEMHINELMRAPLWHKRLSLQQLRELNMLLMTGDNWIDAAETLPPFHGEDQEEGERFMVLIWNEADCVVSLGWRVKTIVRLKNGETITTNKSLVELSEEYDVEDIETVRSNGITDQRYVSNQTGEMVTYWRYLPEGPK